MREQVYTLIKRHSAHPTFDAATPLVQLGIDSMRLIQVILDIETELGLVTPDAYMSEEWFQTADSVARLYEQVAAQAGRA